MQILILIFVYLLNLSSYITPIIYPIAEEITAIVTKIYTVFTSPYPDSSKWWCKGDILKILLPVFLKYATWIITDKVSNI